MITMQKLAWMIPAEMNAASCRYGVYDAYSIAEITRFIVSVTPILVRYLSFLPYEFSSDS